MKKIKSLLLVIVMMMFVSIMNVDAEGVSIKSIKLVDRTGDATELSEPTTSGLNINFDLAFENKDDSVKYEVVLNNPTNTEYEISMDNKFNNSSYMEYSYEFKDKTNRIKANSDVILYITIKYKNTVPADKLVDGKYIENNTMGLFLSNETNPNTYGNIIILIMIILGIIGFTVLSIKFKRKDLLVIVIALALVPVTVFALEKIKLTITTKITIGERYYVFYDLDHVVKTSELNNNKYVYETCTNNIKIMNDDNSYEEYSYCEFLSKKDSTSYVPGDRVVVNTDLEYDDLDDSLCTFDDETGIYTCPSNALKKATDICYGYSCGGIRTMEALDIINECTEEQFNDFDFQNVGTISWEHNWGTVTFSNNGSFIMPNHDMYIETESFCR